MGVMNSAHSTQPLVHLPSIAPWLIAVGLILVLLGQFTELAPILLGVGLLMLGTTIAVSVRVQAPFTTAAVAGNLLIYLGLYALVVGALSHPSPWQGLPAPAWLRMADLGASAGCIVASLRLGLRQFDQSD